MRTIKFRAWDSDDKEMYEPMVLAVVDNGSLSLSPLRYCKDGNRAYKPYHPLMQFTGLHDKNGKECFEGDILDNLEIVVFAQGAFMTSIGALAISIEHREIIGNIHEQQK